MGTIVRLLLVLLLFVGCKSSKELVATRVQKEQKDMVELSKTDIQAIKSIVNDLSVNLNKRLDFIVYDTEKPTLEGRPPVLFEGTVTDNSTITDKGLQQEQINDNSEAVTRDKGKVNIRDKLQVEEKKNNKTWIEQLTKFGVVIILLLGTVIYIKKRWF